MLKARSIDRKLLIRIISKGRFARAAQVLAPRVASLFLNRQNTLLDVGRWTFDVRRSVFSTFISFPFPAPTFLSLIILLP
jgi:hypothetical protein